MVSNSFLFASAKLLLLKMLNFVFGEFGGFWRNKFELGSRDLYFYYKNSA